MITGSLFTDRGDQYDTFKKMKGQKIFYDQWEYGTTIRRRMVPENNNCHLCARLHFAKFLVIDYNRYHHDIRYEWY